MDVHTPPRESGTSSYRKVPEEVDDRTLLRW